MNLVQALNVALPDLPARRDFDTPPRVHPRMIWKQHQEPDGPVVMALIPGRPNMFRFSESQWALIKLFDGTRNWQQIAEDLTAETGIPLNESDVREFASAMDESEFWYRAPYQQIQLHRQADARHKQIKRKSKFGDLAQIELTSFDPDDYVTKVHNTLRFVYTRWFTVATLALFAVMVAISLARWGEIWSDSLTYYNFIQKSGYDLLEFYFLFGFMAFWHESAHALTCKHFGGEVHKMGAMLIYLSPAFFVETAEVWIYGNRWQRILTALAGVWIEMIFCAIATVVWWGTPPGTYVHELAYKFIMIAGIFVIIMNMNPLIKLDGYYIFSELIQITGLKERSTEYVSTWVRRTIFGLPVEVPFVPRKQRKLFIAYAILSGTYSYLVLFIVVRIVYHIAHSYSPDWALLPASYVAWLIFRGRIKKFGAFVRTVYLDKRELMFAKPARTFAIAVTGVVLLLLPLRRIEVEAPFVLEPARLAVLRAEVPGTIDTVSAREGQGVAAGEVLARMSNLALDSRLAESKAAVQSSRAQLRSAELSYGNVAGSRNAAVAARAYSENVSEEANRLTIKSPIAGIITTARPNDLAGTYVDHGTELLQVADISSMRARIFVPEAEMRRLSEIRAIRVKPSSELLPRNASLQQSALSPELPGSDLVPASSLLGTRHGSHYVVLAGVEDPETLKPGVTGTAKLFGPRHSLAYFAWETVRDFIARKVW